MDAGSASGSIPAGDTLACDSPPLSPSLFSQLHTV